MSWALRDGAGGGTAALQPVMCPVSDAKMKRAGALKAPEETTKSEVPLKTWPVGAPPGTVTVSVLFTNGLMVPSVCVTSPLYTVLTSVARAESQKVPLGLM